jgi:hypothetical protein
MGADVNFYPLGNNGGPTLTRMPFGQLNNIYWAWGSGFGQDARGYTRSQYGPTAGAIESYTPAQGGFGLALHFDEWYYLDPAQVFISQTPALELQQFTVEAWAKISPAAAIHTRFTATATSPSAPLSTSSISPTPAAGCISNLAIGSSFLDLYAPLSWDLVQNRWMRFTASWDGSVARIYADGDLIASAAATGTIGYGPNGQARLGSSPDSILYQQWSLTGYLDEVKIWNRVLTAADIYSDNDVNAADTFGLIAAFSFNEPANNDITNLRDDNFGGVLMGEISRVASTVPVRVRIHEDSAVLLYLPNYQLSYESNPTRSTTRSSCPPFTASPRPTRWAIAQPINRRRITSATTPSSISPTRRTTRRP